jgi:peptidyl-tRNA hydrolase, PTH1 family
MKIVVGLGNPGRQYEGTRHNVGWMVLDRLADRAGWSGRSRARDAAAVVYGRYNGLDLMLVKPTTYMNLSGVAVRKVLARERAPLGDLIVVVDDFALPFGRLRLREQGSAGSHNGLRSIVGELGSQKFARLRVGIGEPSRTATDHVLSRFRPDEQDLVDEIVDAAADALEDWARDGVSRAATRWNAWVPRALAVDAAAGSGSASGDTARDRPGPSAPADEPVIVRRATGWRRLLPRATRED